MSELEILQSTMNKLTFNSHANSYRQLKLIPAFFNELHKYEQDYIIDELNKLLIANTRIQFLGTINKFICLFVILKKKHGLPTDKLKLFMNSITSTYKLQRNKLMMNKTENLPSYDEFKHKLEELFLKEDWKKYIINYILFYFFVRNLDLLLTITKSTDITDGLNYFVIKDNTIDYIRTNYKTKKYYGMKTINITDEKFYRAVCILHDKGNFQLLGNINKSSLNNVIQRITINNIGETRILNINVNHFKDDEEMMKKISEYRGTRVSVLLSDYNSSWK
jgi:hypothetical protein